MNNEQNDIDNLLCITNNKNPYLLLYPSNNYQIENHKKNKDDLLISQFLENKGNSTSDSFHIIDRKKNKERIFQIKKEPKKAHKHTKFSSDNIIRKVKRNFVDKCLNYINNKYKNLKGKKLLYRISPKETIEISIEKNLKWFNLKIKDIFSYELSNKCSTKEKDYNKKQIQKIYKEGIQEMIIIFETKVRDIFNDYINDVKREGFDTLKDDVLMIKEKMKKEENADETDINNYINEYIKIAKGLEDIYKNKRPRTKNNYYIEKDIEAIVI